MAAADAAEAGETSAVALHGIVRDHLGHVNTDYVQLASASTCQPVTEAAPGTFLAVAAYVGAARLIDNVAFDPAGAGAGGVVADRGTRLTARSLLYGG